MARIDLLGGYKYSPAFSMNNDVDEVNHRLEFPEPLHGPVLDVLRFHLMDKPGILISSFGLLLFIVGWWIMTLALRENAFAAPAVKYQQEREQTVITTGVCSIVRHPVYAGAIPWLIGMALWLKSYAAALLVVIPILSFAVRILIEEESKRELKGYDAYMKKVRHRLIPFLW